MGHCPPTGDFPHAQVPAHGRDGDCRAARERGTPQAAGRTAGIHHLATWSVPRPRASCASSSRIPGVGDVRPDRAAGTSRRRWIAPTALLRADRDARGAMSGWGEAGYGSAQSRPPFTSMFVVLFPGCMSATCPIIPSTTFIRLHKPPSDCGCPEECVYDQTKLVVLTSSSRAAPQPGLCRLCQYFRIARATTPRARASMYVKHNALAGEFFDDRNTEAYLMDSRQCARATGEAGRASSGICAVHAEALPHPGAGGADADRAPQWWTRPA